MNTVKIEVVNDCDEKLTTQVHNLSLPVLKGNTYEFPADCIRVTGLPDKSAKYRELCEWITRYYTDSLGRENIDDIKKKLAAIDAEQESYTDRLQHTPECICDKCKPQESKPEPVVDVKSIDIETSILSPMEQVETLVRKVDKLDRKMSKFEEEKVADKADVLFQLKHELNTKLAKLERADPWPVIEAIVQDMYAIKANLDFPLSMVSKVQLAQARKERGAK